LPLTRLRLAVALLLAHPQLAAPIHALEDDWRCLNNPGVGLLCKLLDRISAYPEITTGALMENWDEQDGRYVKRLANPSLLSNIPADGQEAELLGALSALNKEAREAEGERLYNRASPSQLSDEEKRRLRGILSGPRRDESHE
jgi:DNA primase